jgi:hypothetical protein
VARVAIWPANPLDVESANVPIYEGDDSVIAFSAPKDYLFRQSRARFGIAPPHGFVDRHFILEDASGRRGEYNVKPL